MSLPALHSTRNFGIEIECFGISIDAALIALQNVGIDIAYEGYNHHTRPTWKIVTDSSVCDGFEVVSPILSGNEGLQAVVKVAKTLRSAGARVDRRCGFHVHVNARDLSGADILNIIRRYARHEALIDTLMPRSRRGMSNSYCRAMGDVVRTVENVSESATTRHVCERVQERYYKLNVHSFIRHGTVEFRQHSGTVDYHKMVNWIIFCIQFVEDSRTIRVPVTTTNAQGVSLRRNAIEHKFRRLAEILDQHADRYTPCHGSEIARELGVEESTVPSYISQFRARYPQSEISARRNRGYYRSSVNQLVPMVTAASPSIPTERVEQPEDRGVFAFLSPDVTRYFQERIQDLALT
jgi:biotin operon repressor